MGQLLLLLLLVGGGARQEVVRREVGVREVRVEEKGRVVREVGERGWMESRLCQICKNKVLSMGPMILGCIKTF